MSPNGFLWNSSTGPGIVSRIIIEGIVFSAGLAALQAKQRLYWTAISAYEARVIRKTTAHMDIVAPLTHAHTYENFGTFVFITRSAACRFQTQRDVNEKSTSENTALAIEHSASLRRSWLSNGCAPSVAPLLHLSWASVVLLMSSLM